MKLSQAIREYLGALKTQGLSPHTLSAYGPWLAEFKQRMRNPDVSRIKRRHTLGFINHLKVRQARGWRAAQAKRGRKMPAGRLSISSVNLAFSAIRGLSQHLMDADIIVADFTRGIHLIKRPSREAEPVPGAVLGFLWKLMREKIASVNPRTSYIARRDYTLFRLMSLTGLRRAEAVSLNIKDVDDKDEMRIVGKGQKLGHVPLGQNARGLLRDYLPFRKAVSSKFDSLFLSAHRKKLSLSAVNRLFKDWLRLAAKKGFIQEEDVHKFSPHKIRHTAGTNFYKKSGGDIRKTQKFLRHESIQTTQIYTHTKDSEVAEVAEGLA